MTNNRNAYEVRDMTNSRVLGTVQSVSEYGARRAGAKTFNLPYAHVAVSLIVQTVADVYAASTETVPAEKWNDERSQMYGNTRTRGEYVALLNETITSGILESRGYVSPGQLALIVNRDASMCTVVSSEGVGMTTALDGRDIRLYAVQGMMWEEATLTPAHIVQAITGERMDIADFVRVFGSRLDANAYGLVRFARTTGGAL